jgi:hypothetical protein
MSSLVTTTVALVPNRLSILMDRLNGKRKSTQPHHAFQAPVPLSNLPEVDKVDIRALFRKWED